MQLKTKNTGIQAPATRTVTEVSRNSNLVQEVSGRVIVMPTPGEGFNGVSKISPGTMGGAASFINLTLDNSGGATEKFYGVGDPTGMLAAIDGRTLAPADNGSFGALTGEIFNKTMFQRSYAIDRINYKVTQSATQFSNPFVVLTADVNGELKKSPYNIAGASRPNNFNPLELVLDMNGEVVLDLNNALSIVVAAGEKVTLSISFRAVGN